MRSAAPVLAPAAPPPPTLREAPRRRREPEFLFQSLVLTEPHSLAKGKSTTFSVSLLLHSLLLAALIIVPLVGEESPPGVSEAVRAFFVAPAHVAPPPPPPPPAPAASARIAPKAPAAPRPAEEAKFVAPIEVPTEIRPEETVDVAGAEGVPGGVEGGVPGGMPGGVIGGIVGGLQEAPPPPKVVRVGGAIVAPKLVHYVAPVYPQLAIQARISGVVILEAQVDTRGHVSTARILRGKPFIEDAALDAVKQWRYQPLLLNGKPTEFILTVTLVFDLASARPSANDPQ